jgi:hypothetical protein
MSALWLLVDPHFVISDNETQKVVTFLMILMHQADTSKIMLLLFCQLFWNPSCRNFIEVKPVVHDFIDKAMRLIHSWFAISSAVTLLLLRINLQT